VTISWHLRLPLALNLVLGAILLVLPFPAAGHPAVATVPAPARHQTTRSRPADALPNPIRIENALPGNADWPITKLATAGQIEGYADHVSVNSGTSIGFYVTVSPTKNSKSGERQPELARASPSGQCCCTCQRSRVFSGNSRFRDGRRG
jgi:hypothetical protein